MESMNKEEMAQLLQDVPASNPSMEEWIYTVCIRGGYIIYDSRKNKAVCTRCGSEWELYPGEYSRMHGMGERCPCCGEVGILLAAGRGRSKYTEYLRVLSFACYEGTLYAFLNSIVARFETFGRPTLYNSLDEVYIINKDEQTRWHRSSSYYGDITYERINNLKVPNPQGTIYGCSKYRDYAYTYGLNEMIAESDCRYLVQAPALKECSDMDLPTVLGTMMQYQSLELLDKAGFGRIAKHKIEGCGSRAVNWRANNLEKILKLPMGDVRKLREWNPDIRALEIYQKLAPEERRIVTKGVLRDMIGYEGHYMRTRNSVTYKEAVEKYMPIDKWMRWAATQSHYMDDSHPHLLRDYTDYMEACEKLGRDIKKKSVLRPKDLTEAHDEAASSLKIERNAMIDKAIAENSRSEDFEAFNLIIRSATCQEDLNKESAKLGHCVKTYGDKVARGDCYIFFVRHAEAPDIPFYTLETTPTGKLVQCRGQHNCSMTDEVKLFTDAFVRKLEAEIRKEEKEKCLTA